MRAAAAVGTRARSSPPQMVTCGPAARSAGRPGTSAAPRRGAALVPGLPALLAAGPQVAIWGGDERARVPTAAAARNVRYLEVIQPLVLPPPFGRPEDDARLVLQAHKEFRFRWRDPYTGTLLYEYTGWQPRAYVVPDAEPVPDAAAALARGPRAGRVVVVADAAWDATQALRSRRPAPQPRIVPRCDIQAYRNQSVRIAVATPTDGYLVLTDNAYPGWVAEVDGEARPILLADGAVRAVWVEAGRHEVVFRFRPLVWWLGVALTVLALLALAAASRRRRGG